MGACAAVPENKGKPNDPSKTQSDQKDDQKGKFPNVNIVVENTKQCNLEFATNSLGSYVRKGFEWLLIDNGQTIILNSNGVELADELPFTKSAVLITLGPKDKPEEEENKTGENKERDDDEKEEEKKYKNTEAKLFDSVITIRSKSTKGNSGPKRIVKWYYHLLKPNDVLHEYGYTQWKTIYDPYAPVYFNTFEISGTGLKTCCQPISKHVTDQEREWTTTSYPYEIGKNKGELGYRYETFETTNYPGRLVSSIKI